MSGCSLSAVRGVTKDELHNLCAMGVLQEVARRNFVPCGVLDETVPLLAPCGDEHVVVGSPYEVNRQGSDVDLREAFLLDGCVPRDGVVGGNAQGADDQYRCCTAFDSKPIKSIIR